MCCGSWGCKELDTTERLTLSFFTFPIPYASHFRSFLFTPSPYPATTLVVPVNLLCLHRSDFLNFSAPTNHPGPLGGSDFIRGGGVEICYFYKQPQGILIRRLPSPLFMDRRKCSRHCLNPSSRLLPVIPACPDISPRHKPPCGFRNPFRLDPVSKLYVSSAGFAGHPSARLLKIQASVLWVWMDSGSW